MELKEIQYDYIVNLTKFFLEKKKTGELKSFEQVIHNIKTLVPSITNFSYKFDEEIWLPTEPELYNNLIEFKVQLYGTVEYLPFRLMLNKDYEQEPIYLNQNMIWQECKLQS